MTDASLTRLAAEKDTGPSQLFALARLVEDVVETAIRKRNAPTSFGRITELKLPDSNLTLFLERGEARGEAEVNGEAVQYEVARSFVRVVEGRNQVLSFGMDDYRATGEHAFLPNHHDGAGAHAQGEWIQKVIAVHTRMPTRFTLNRTPAEQTMKAPAKPRLIP